MYVQRHGSLLTASVKQRRNKCRHKLYFSVICVKHETRRQRTNLLRGVKNTHVTRASSITIEIS